MSVSKSGVLATVEWIPSAILCANVTAAYAALTLVSQTCIACTDHNNPICVLRLT